MAEVHGGQEIDVVNYGEDYIATFDRRTTGLFGWLGHRHLAHRLRAVLALARPGSHILDVGCAQGTFALMLVEGGFQVTALEVNPAFLGYAQRKDVTGAVTWVAADFLEYGGGPFDVVVMGELVEHTGAPEELIEAAARALRPGGAVIVTTPNGERLGWHLPTFLQWAEQHPERRELRYLGPAGEHHVFAFTRRELRALLAPHFTDINISPSATAVANRLTGSLLDWGPSRRIVELADSAAAHIPSLVNGWIVSAKRVAG